MPILPYKQDGIRKEMENLLKKLEVNIDELPQFTVPRVKLQNLLTEIVTLSNEQNTYRYSKQQTTKRLTAALEEGRKLLNFFWVGLKEHYGTRNEKLVEFGLQPYRGRARKEEEPTVKKPAAQPAAPETGKPEVDEPES
ncbi:MAG TPA: hypothetical protein VEL74_06015 [Thermoanaerobaculia bacterium]|nr:hypothetical protein [Thermoanaerobaculia bacterium]